MNTFIAGNIWLDMHFPAVFSRITLLPKNLTFAVDWHIYWQDARSRWKTVIFNLKKLKSFEGSVLYDSVSMSWRLPLTRVIFFRQEKKALTQSLCWQHDSANVNGISWTPVVETSKSVITLPIDVLVAFGPVFPASRVQQYKPVLWSCLSRWERRRPDFVRYPKSDIFPKATSYNRYSQIIFIWTPEHEL